VSLPFAPLATQPLEPCLAALLQALLHRPIAFGTLPLDPLPLRLLGALPLDSATLEREYVRVTATEASRGHRPAVRSQVGDAIVPSEPHAASGLAASEAL
jgi:hypothetical protein